MMFFRKKLLAGIDIGNYSIKAAFMNTNRKQIADLVEKVILPDRKSIEDVVDEDKIASVCREVMGEYIQQNSGYDLEIASSVQGEGVICSYIEFPPLEKKKLELAIQSATIKFIPYPIAESVITYIPVPPLKDTANDSKAFFFASINKSYIDKRSALLEKLGISSKRTETFIIPMIKGFTGNQGKFPGEFQAVVNAGSRFTSVAVLRDGFPYYARDFNIGGADFTYAFQMAAQSSWKDAMEYKHNYDCTLKDHSIESVLLRWLDQLRKSLSAFTRLDRKADLSISRIFLTGGTARLKNLDVRITDYLSIPVTIDSWNQFKPENKNRDSFPGSFNISLGLNL